MQNTFAFKFVQKTFAFKFVQKTFAFKFVKKNMFAVKFVQNTRHFHPSEIKGDEEDLSESFEFNSSFTGFYPVVPSKTNNQI